MEEIWREIPGYKGRYKISNKGNIISFAQSKSGKLLKNHSDSYGYTRCSITIDGISKRKLVHRLVMLSFEGYSELEVNHKDGDVKNNNLENLEYLSRSENLLHRYRVLGKESRIGKSSGKNKFEGKVYVGDTYKRDKYVKREEFIYHGKVYK